MLYWGIFTSGFIIGAFVAAHIFTQKDIVDVVPGDKNIEITSYTFQEGVGTIFDRLTKINYISGNSKGQNSLQVTKLVHNNQ